MPTQFAYFSICFIPAKYANCVLAYFSICSMRVKYATCVRVFLYMFHASEIRQHNLRISLYVLCH